MLRALLFDFDGTLFDLDVDWKEHMLKVCEGYLGCRYKNLSAHDFLVVYNNEVRHTLPENIKDEIRRIREEDEKGGVLTGRAVPNSEQTIKELAGKYPLGIISGNQRKTIELWIEKTGLKGVFKTIVSINDSKLHKPNKMPFEIALKKLGFRPEQAVYVGNHPGDVVAAKSAGLKCIILLYNHKKEEFKVRPDRFIKSLSELKVALKLISLKG